MIAISQFKPLVHLPVSHKQIFHVSKIVTSATDTSVLNTFLMLVGQLPCHIWYSIESLKTSVYIRNWISNRTSTLAAPQDLLSPMIKLSRIEV
jgi:chromosome condensin MukBEF MukE localization factor